MERLKLIKERLARIEKAIKYEKSINRGEETNAYKIWKFLMDNGPSTADQIKSIFPPEKHGTISSNLHGFPTKGVITKNGNLYAANPDYEWDDVGVIRRPSQSDIRKAMRNVAETPVGSSTRTETPARASRVKQNIWSKKLAEVKAAVENGADVNQVNKYGRTPLAVAINSSVEGSDDIAKYLLDHGANPNVMIKDMPIIFKALDENKLDIAKLMVDHGANITLRYRSRNPLDVAMDSVITDEELIEDLCNENTASVKLFTYLAHLERQSKISSSFVAKLADKYIPAVLSEDYYLPAWTQPVITQLNNTSAKPSILRAMLSANVFPLLFKHQVNDLFSTEALNLIYNAAKKNIDKLNIASTEEFIGVVKEVCKRLNKSDSFLTSNVTSIEYLTKADDISQIFSDAVLAHDIETLNKIAKVNRRFKVYDISIEHLSKMSDNKLTAAACKAMHRCIFSEHIIAGIIHNSKNEYLVEWFVEKAPAVVKYIKKYAVNSEVVDKVLQSYDFDNKELDSMEDTWSYNSTVDNVIKSIVRDEYAKVEFYISKHPELLDNEDIIEVANDPRNDGSYAARAVRRLINERPKSKYNF